MAEHLKVGDRVTRDGHDLYEVVAMNPDGFAGEFRCIEPPASGIPAAGDVRYEVASLFRRA